MKKFSFLILLFYSKYALNQIPATSNWLGLQLLFHGRKWEWVNDAGYRTIGMSSSSYSCLFRSGIRYKVDETWTISMGTAVFFTRTTYQKLNHEFGREMRLWQELNFQKAISKTFQLRDRFRTEQRWFDAVTGKNAYFGFRLRDRLTLIRPLSEKWTLEMGDEYLEMLANKKFEFNSNRILFLALYKMKREAQIQGGYIWLKLPTSSQHVFTLSFQKGISWHVKG